MKRTGTPPKRPSVDELGEAEARLVERGVEAVHEDEHVAVRADASRQVRGELRSEALDFNRRGLRDDEMIARVRLAP